MKERYKVRTIYEDDYGCEERSEDYEPQVIVILESQSTDGNELRVKQADSWMYQQDINEGDEVLFVEGRLQKDK